MSTNKKLKDYIPGQDDFLSFANTMNNNAAIDMARNNITSPNSPTTPSTGLQSGGVTLTGGNAPAAAPLKIDNALGGAPVLGDVAPVNNGEVETGTGTGTEIGTETVTDAGTGITAPPQTYVPSISDDEKDYDTWYGEQGVDLDRQYGDAKAALEYEYMTSMATYGQRAEQLYQMGLSGSGLSDIFQANAFSAYLNQQNALANQLIEQKKQMRLDYNNYLSERNAGIKTDTANAYNLGLTQYDGANADYVRKLLSGQGYHSQVIDNVMNALTAIDTDTLPIVKQKAAKDELEKKLTTLAFNSYNGDNIGEVETLLLSEANADTEMVNRIITGLRAMTPEQLADSTAYKAKLAQDAANAEQKVTAAVTFVLENKLYNGKNLDQVKGYLESIGYDTDVVEEAVSRLGKLPQESINGDSVTVTGTNAEGDEVEYTISQERLSQGMALVSELPANTSRDQMAALLQGQNFTEAEINAIYQYFKNTNEIGEQINTGALGAELDKEFSDIDIEALTITNASEFLAQAKEIYGKDSEEYNKFKETVDTKLGEAFDWATSEDDGRNNLADAYALAGYSEADWNSMEEGEQYLALLNKAGEAHEQGYLLTDSYSDLIDTWISDQTTMFKSYDESYNKSKGFNEAGTLAYQLYEMYSEGYMSKGMYYGKLDKIISDMEFKFDGAKLKYADTVGNDVMWGGSKQTIVIKANALNPAMNPPVTDDDLASRLSGYINTGANFVGVTLKVERSSAMNNSTNSLSKAIGYGGKLYAYNERNSTWYEILPDEIQGMRNNDALREGVYHLLARYFDAAARQEKLDNLQNYHGR